MNAGALRGRGARHRDWKWVFAHLRANFAEHDVSIVAAGVTFFLMLSLFPALVAAFSIYGYFNDPVALERQLGVVTRLFPGEVEALVARTMHRIVAQSRQSLGIQAVIGVLIAMLSARKGIGSLIRALNIIYGVEKGRSFIGLAAVSLGFTTIAVTLLIVAIALVAAWPAVADLLPLPGTIRAAVAWLRWPFLGLVLAGGLAAVYRYGPNRRHPPWRGVAWGAGVATVLWILASFALSYYMSTFGAMERFFGALAGVAALMLWLDVTSLVVLLGAELNSSMEAEARRGAPEPRPVSA